MTTDLSREMSALASRYGLDMDPATLKLIEAGLDFRVALGKTTNGESWVLRVPRRAGMDAQIASEAAILDLVASELPVAVPRWTIRNAELIAYRALPGQPGLTIDGDGTLHWLVDLNSRRYAEEVGMLLAKLHGIDVERARAVGVPVDEPDQVRERWRRNIATVTAEFTIADHLRERWEAWLNDDSFWPTWSVMTHGELYPAHILIDSENSITGVLDWTTAQVSDPARDFSFHRAMLSPELFELIVETYVRCGGQTWPRLADHAAELWAASPIAYGLFALQTGKEEHRAAAQAQLAPRRLKELLGAERVRAYPSGHQLVKSAHCGHRIHEVDRQWTAHDSSEAESNQHNDIRNRSARGDKASEPLQKR